MYTHTHICTHIFSIVCIDMFLSHIWKSCHAIYCWAGEYVAQSPTEIWAAAGGPGLSQARDAQWVSTLRPVDGHSTTLCIATE